MFHNKILPASSLSLNGKKVSPYPHILVQLFQSSGLSAWILDDKPDALELLDEADLRVELAPRELGAASFHLRPVAVAERGQRGVGLRFRNVIFHMLCCQLNSLHLKLLRADTETILNAMNQSLPTSYLGPEKRRQLLIHREVKRLSGICIRGRLPPTASTVGRRQAGGEEGSGPAAAVADEGQGVVQPHGEGVAGELPQVQPRLLPE